MAGLHDQSANEPLLDNVIEQQLDNLTPQSLHQNRNNLGTFNGEHNDAFRSLFPDQTTLSVVCIVGGFVIAGELAIAHYAFLRYLHGRNIDEYPQVWIKGANNGFSNIFSIFVGLSASSALTQIKWRASGSEPLRTYTIDNLFALPAPLALLKTLMRPRGSLFFPILSSVLIQALVLVSILTPSALTVAPSEQVPHEMRIPMLNLTSQAQFAKATYNGSTSSSDGFLLTHIELTTMGEERINSVLLNLPEFIWPIPQDCGLKCTFSFEYTAPGLECDDVIPENSSIPSNTNIYEADTNLYPPNVTASYAPFDLSVNYTAITSSGGNQTLSPGAATYCRFYQATYNASFELNTNSSTQRAGTSIISQREYLSWADIATGVISHSKRTERAASWAICYAFAMAFRGRSPAPNEMAQTQPILTSIFNIPQSGNSFELAVPDLSQGLVDLFSNLTLSLLLTRGGQDAIITNATIWDGSTVWVYTTWILWATYVPALLLATTVGLYGLYAIDVSKIAMDDGFSTFLLATQNAELSEMCKKAAAFDELQRLQLIHEKNGIFVIVDSNLASAN